MLQSYKVSASDYLDLLRSNEEDHNVSNLVTVPTNFMLQHEAVVVLIKAQEIEEAFKLCQSLIGEFEPGCGLWKSDLFWADELNDYNFNVLGTMLLAETGLNKNTETVLEALNKYTPIAKRIGYSVNNSLITGLTIVCMPKSAATIQQRQMAMAKISKSYDKFSWVKYCYLKPQF